MHSNICAYLPRVKMEGRLLLIEAKETLIGQDVLLISKVSLQMLKEEM